MADSQTKDAPETDEQQEERQPLKLEVKIDSPSACQRHITVKIPHEDVERYFDQAFGEIDARGSGARLSRRPRAAKAGGASLPQGSERSGEKQSC